MNGREVWRHFRKTGAGWEELSAPLARRILHAIYYMQAATRIWSIYGRAHRQEQGFGDEIVEVSGLLLQLNVLATGLIDQFLKGASPNDSVYQRLGKTRQSVADFIAQTLSMLKEKHAYRVPALIRLAGHLEDTLPELMPRLPQAAQSEIAGRVQQLAREETDADLKPALSDLQKALAASGR